MAPGACRASEWKEIRVMIRTVLHDANSGSLRALVCLLTVACNDLDAPTNFSTSVAEGGGTGGVRWCR